jgi:hypothetical protein
MRWVTPDRVLSLIVSKLSYRLAGFHRKTHAEGGLKRAGLLTDGQRVPS